MWSVRTRGQCQELRSATTAWDEAAELRVQPAAKAGEEQVAVEEGWSSPRLMRRWKHLSLQSWWWLTGCFSLWINRSRRRRKLFEAWNKELEISSFLSGKLSLYRATIGLSTKNCNKINNLLASWVFILMSCVGWWGRGMVKSYRGHTDCLRSINLLVDTQELIHPLIVTLKLHSGKLAASTNSWCHLCSYHAQMPSSNPSSISLSNSFSSFLKVHPGIHSK